MILKKLGRTEEMFARDCLANPSLLSLALTEKRWSDVESVLTFIQHDVSPDVAMTDPTLYTTLRNQITRFYLRGGGAFNLKKIQELAAQQTSNKS